MLFYMCLFITSLLGSNLHHQQDVNPLEDPNNKPSQTSFIDLPSYAKSHIFSYFNKEDRKNLSLVSLETSNLNNQNIKEIKIYKMKDVTEEEIKKVFGKLSRLQSIKFIERYYYNEDFLNILISQVFDSERITKLNFSGCSWVTDNILSSIPENITSLKLSWCRKITDAGLKLLPSYLTHLNLNNCDNITDAGFKLLPSHLTHLSLNYCEITNEGLKGLPTGLAHLNLRWCIRITDAGFNLLPLYVTHLNLRQSLITDACLEHLYRLKDLKFIDLTECNVTEQGMQKLKSHLPNLTIQR